MYHIEKMSATTSYDASCPYCGQNDRRLPQNTREVLRGHGTPYVSGENGLKRRIYQKCVIDCVLLVVTFPEDSS